MRRAVTVLVKIVFLNFIILLQTLDVVVFVR